MIRKRQHVLVDVLDHEGVEQRTCDDRLVDSEVEFQV